MAIMQDQFDAETVCAAIAWLRQCQGTPTLRAFHNFYGAHNLEDTKAFLMHLQEAGVSFRQKRPVALLALHDVIPLDDFDWLAAPVVSAKAAQIISDPAVWSLGGTPISSIGWPYAEVSVQPWVDSTQRWAQQSASATPFDRHFSPRVFLADYQSQGRGRRQRQWHARVGQCLMMTVSFSVPRSALDQRLSPAFATLLCDWLNQRYAFPAQVKWPNDLLFDGHKLAGFLIQTTPMRTTDSLMPGEDALCLMMGLGLNLTIDPKSQGAIGQPALGIRDTGYRFPDKATLAAEVLLVFARLFEAMQTRNWQFLQSMWPRYDAYHQQPVRLEMNKQENIEGTNVGIDRDGQLLLRLEDGRTQSFCIGEVSLRKGLT